MLVLQLIEPLLWEYASTLSAIYTTLAVVTGLTPLQITHQAADMVGLDQSAGFADITIAALS